MFSKGTALDLMKDLVALHLAEVVPKDKDATGLKIRQQSYRIRLADDFLSFLLTTFKGVGH